MSTATLQSPPEQGIDPHSTPVTPAIGWTCFNPRLSRASILTHRDRFRSWCVQVCFNPRLSRASILTELHTKYTICAFELQSPPEQGIDPHIRTSCRTISRIRMLQSPPEQGIDPHSATR